MPSTSGNNDIEEVHVLQVTASSGPNKVRNIGCRITLPMKNSDDVRLELSATDRQLEALQQLSEFNISGPIRRIPGVISCRVEASKVYLMSARREAPALGAPKAWHCTAGAADITIAQLLGSKVPRHGNFWITPSPVLSPAVIRTFSYTGKVSIHYSNIFESVLESGLRLSFKKHFKQVAKGKETDTTLSQLVAEFDYPKNRENAVLALHKRFVPDLDDFLLICSFASRQKTVCPGWTLIDTRRLVRHYRKAVAIPPTQDISLNDTLIDIREFKSFILMAYQRFCCLSDNDKITVRQALAYAIPRKRTFENSFISLYSSIENLMSLSIGKPDVGGIFSPEEWGQLHSDLKVYLKNHPSLAGNKQKRGLVYQKLGELNRLSFATQFNKFVHTHSVDLSDLWPCVANDGLASLSAIRNKIIHGGTFQPSQSQALIVAKEHLNWTVERLLLGFLNWPVSLSRVSGDFLSRNHVDHSGWQSSRATLSS